jgi:hypothetical protein
MVRRTTGTAGLLSVTCVAALLAACTATGQPDGSRTSPSPAPPQVHTAELRLPEAPATVVDGVDAATLAAGTSAALFTSAPVAVVAQDFDPERLLRAASLAVALGAPLLLDASATPATSARTGAGADPAVGPSAGPTEPPAQAPDDVTAAELDRLGVLAVLTVGDVQIEATPTMDVVPAPDDDAALAALLGLTLERTVVEATGDPAVDVSAVAGLDRAAPLLLSIGPAPAADADTAEPDPDEESGAATPGADDANAGDPSPTGDSSPTSEPTEPGDTSDPGESSDLTEPTEPSEPTDPGETPAGPALPLTELAEPPTGGLVLTTGDPADLAAVATARAAGVDVLTVVSGDPRVEPAVIRVIADARPESTIGLGAAFGTSEDLSWKVATAATGVELPGGGQTLFPGRRMVAMYGTPPFPGLGILGEQDVPASIARVRQMVAEYQPLTTDVVVPAFEMIVTVASAGPGEDGNYSNELPVETFIPWVEAARDAGVYVVLDLQPGRTDFVTQARLYEPLLRYPNVGLALDPEWRLAADQVHLVQIGSVDVSEVNAVGDYLAELTRTNHLPQKLLILHQFMLRMIQGRENVNTSHPELAVLIHADGQGSQGGKNGTWEALHQGAPPGVVWGWKNFIDEDLPMLTPAQTYQVAPAPHFVSYQ